MGPQLQKRNKNKLREMETGLPSPSSSMTWPLVEQTFMATAESRAKLCVLIAPRPHKELNPCVDNEHWPGSDRKQTKPFGGYFRAIFAISAISGRGNAYNLQ